MTIYCQELNHLLEMYATHGIIAETDSEIAGYVKLSSIWQFQFAKELWLKTLSSQHIYEDYFLKGIIV